MKKILIFSLNYYPKYVGGAEVAIKDIVERVHLNKDQDGNKKFEFHMLTLRFDSHLPKYEEIYGIKIHRIGFTKANASINDLKNSWLKYNKYYYQMFAWIYALRLNNKYKYDAIWAMMAHSTGVPAGIFKYFKPQIKYILTLQEGDPPEYIESLARPFPKYLNLFNNISFKLFKNGFTRADIVQSISTFLDTWAIKMGNKNARVIIPNAVDVKRFTRAISEQEIIKVKNILGKKEGQIWLITTSRLVYKNGIDDVIYAISKLDDKYHFVILGIGPDEGKYKNLAKSLNIENRIHFMGQISHPKMAIYLKACDIFIRPSRSEGMGNSFVEAMSMKIPVIATTEGGLSDFIFDGQTAWVVEKDNPKSIVDVMQKIENISADDKNKILKSAYDMVLKKYDWNKIAIDMESQVFDKI